MQTHWLIAVCLLIAPPCVALGQAQVEHRPANIERLRGLESAATQGDDLVGQLASARPATRDRAKHRLQILGETAKDALQRGLESQDLEVRTTCRQLLIQLNEVRLERKLSLLIFDTQAKVELPAWNSFQELAGDTLATRRLFAAMVRDYGDSIQWLDNLDGLSSAALEEALLEVDSRLPIDLARMNDGDAVRWAVLLLAGTHESLQTTPVLASRLRSGLLSANVAQRLNASPHCDALRQLVGNWLLATSHHYVNSTMLKIALVYQCEPVAMELAGQSLANQQTSPAGIATSLILLARLDPEKARVVLRHWVDDRRVCHIWQIVASRRRAVQTQVGDVATAILLYLDERDPREFGFTDIEADPDTIFRECSMGFEDEESRQRAYTEAHALLEIRQPKIITP
jgi:hypothetical protein